MLSGSGKYPAANVHQLSWCPHGEVPLAVGSRFLQQRINWILNLRLWIAVCPCLISFAMVSVARLAQVCTPWSVLAQPSLVPRFRFPFCSVVSLVSLHHWHILNFLLEYRYESSKWTHVRCQFLYYASRSLDLRIHLSMWPLVKWQHGLLVGI